MVPNCPSVSSSAFSIPALSSPLPRGSSPRVIIQQVQLGPNVIHMRNLQIWPNVGIQRSDSGYTTNPALYWDFCRWPNPGSLVYSYHLCPNVRKPPINISSFQGSMIKTQTKRCFWAYFCDIWRSQAGLQDHYIHYFITCHKSWAVLLSATVPRAPRRFSLTDFKVRSKYNERVRITDGRPPQASLTLHRQA